MTILCERSFIVRTSSLFGKQGDNFVKKVISHAKLRTDLAIASDQIGSPTYSLDLARFIVFLMETEKFGLYHASNKGCCSRYEFAMEIINHLPISDALLTPVCSEVFMLPALRPVFSALDDEAIRLNGLPEFHDWKGALRAFLQDDYEIE